MRIAIRNSKGAQPNSKACNSPLHCPQLVYSARSGCGASGGDLCLNKSLESMCIFLKRRAEIRKRFTPCLEDSTKTSLYALQWQCGHGCWLDYSKNVMRLLRTGRGFAEVERRFWPEGGVETRAIFFSKEQSQKWMVKTRRDWKAAWQSSQPISHDSCQKSVVFKTGSYGTYYKGEITLGSSWHTRLSPELFSSSTEQLFWEKMRNFIYKIGIEQPLGPQGRSNDSISVKENLPLLRKVQLSAADVIQDDSLIKVLKT